MKPTVVFTVVVGVVEPDALEVVEVVVVVRVVVEVDSVEAVEAVEVVVVEVVTLAASEMTVTALVTSSLTKTSPLPES